MSTSAKRERVPVAALLGEQHGEEVVELSRAREAGDRVGDVLGQGRHQLAGDRAVDRAEHLRQPRRRPRELASGAGAEAGLDHPHEQGLKLGEVLGYPGRPVGTRAQSGQLRHVGALGLVQLARRPRPGERRADRRDQLRGLLRELAQGQRAELGQRGAIDDPGDPVLGQLLTRRARKRDRDWERTVHRRQASPRPGRHPGLDSAAASWRTREHRTGETTTTGGPPEGDAIIGATLEGLRRAAEEVEHVAEVAETLQRSLLPERLPELPGLSIAARYVAGSADAQVGGDWYDVIALRDGHAGVAIGDVVGHGLDAAARMARLQNALRAYALEGLRPSLVLERMNGFAREVSGGPMATLLYGVVDPDEGRLRLATAGHPPVLVIGPSGDAYFAEGPAGSPLGVVPFPSYEESTIPLVPGSTVLLYTDGLVERPEAPLDEGLEWLRGFAVRGPGASRRALRGVAPGPLPRGAAARRRRPARGPARAGADRAHGAHPAGGARVAGADAPRARALAARGRGQRRRDLRVAGRLRRGLRQRDRPRLPSGRGLLRGRVPPARGRDRAPGPRLRQLAGAADRIPGPRAGTDRGS